MKNISIFQIVFLCVFALFFMGGIIVVTIYSARGGTNALKPISVTVWGTFSQTMMQPVLDNTTRTSKDMQITYVQKSESTFDSDLVEAIATGRGPDIVLLPHDSLVSSLNKLSYFSYDRYPARDFRDTFIEESELFLASYGVLAVPFTVDPLVLYWNRDLFSRGGDANPPHYWDEVFSLATSLTSRDATGAILQSGVGLGNYDNIDHAKDILSALFIQSGNKITTWNSQFTSVYVTLSQAPTPPESVLSFYTQFSDPRKPVYSWNRSLLDSQSMFLANRLALYFGFASELSTIRAKSPNLNFDVTFLPQSRNTSVPVTFGRLYGLAVVRSSKDPLGSAEAIQALTSKDAIAAFVAASGLPSVRKDIVAKANDPYQAIFFQSALVSRGWLDPNRKASDTIFKDMIESVVSGFTTPQEAIGQAEQQLTYYSPR